MKTIVLYSTKTGNTKMVAEAIAKALPNGTPCENIADTKAEFADYDLVFMGYWVDRGTADKASRQILATLNNKYIALFATLGADPKSDHAKKCLENGALLLPQGKKPLGSFICQGKIDPKLLEIMYKQFPADNVHGKNPASEARAKQASTHPDAQDLAEAAAFAQDVLAKAREMERREGE